MRRRRGKKKKKKKKKKNTNYTNYTNHNNDNNPSSCLEHVKQATALISMLRTANVGDAAQG